MMSCLKVVIMGGKRGKISNRRAEALYSLGVSAFKKDDRLASGIVVGRSWSMALGLILNRILDGGAFFL